MKTVYVGLSGGVDSSVSAALLKEQGYRVVGVYMKNWTQDVGGIACPWAEDLADARAAAAVLDIPFKVFDFQKEYKERVVDVMVAEYVAGRTPNPDVLCNEDIKFKLFLETALADGADMIATGHYARTDGGRLLRGRDHNKDQTYFLYRVTKEALERTLFPVGELEKPEVRKLAAKFKLPTATKPDSQGICFVGEVGIKDFLQDRVETVPGPVVCDGKTIGEHDGAVLYTVGQRHGLGIGGGKPYYVASKDITTNTVYVTDDPNDLSLERGRFDLQQPHWIASEPELGKSYHVRIRHRGGLTSAMLSKAGNNFSVQLESPERAVAVGQSAVIYDGEVVLGGGIIT
jgi:tRNA-specific 2-thiouridylase